MAKHDMVFLIDVDNTLLDNDRVSADLMRHLVAEVGRQRQQRYWELFEELRKELGYADYLGALQRYRLENPRDPNLLTVSMYLRRLPVREPALPELARRDRASQALGTGGDSLRRRRGLSAAQDRALRALYEAVEHNVLIYIHKEQELDDVERRYPAKHYVLVDDKVRILDAIKGAGGRGSPPCSRARATMPHDTAEVAKYRAPDVTLDRVGALVEHDGPALRRAAKAIPAASTAHSGMRKKTSRV